MADPLTTRQAPIFLIDRRETRRTTTRLLEPASAIQFVLEWKVKRDVLAGWSPLGSENQASVELKPPLPAICSFHC